MNLASLIFASISLARPIAWDMEIGRWIAISFLILGFHSDIKQFNIALGGRPKTQFPRFSNWV